MVPEKHSDRPVGFALSDHLCNIFNSLPSLGDYMYFCTFLKSARDPLLRQPDLVPLNELIQISSVEVNGPPNNVVGQFVLLPGSEEGSLFSAEYAIACLTPLRGAGEGVGLHLLDFAGESYWRSNWTPFGTLRFQTYPWAYVWYQQ